MSGIDCSPLSTQLSTAVQHCLQAQTQITREWSTAINDFQSQRALCYPSSLNLLSSISLHETDSPSGAWEAFIRERGGKTTTCQLTVLSFRYSFPPPKKSVSFLLVLVHQTPGIAESSTASRAGNGKQRGKSSWNNGEHGYFQLLMTNK